MDYTFHKKLQEQKKSRIKKRTKVATEMNRNLTQNPEKLQMTEDTLPTSPIGDNSMKEL